MANDETSKVDERLLHRLADGDLSEPERAKLQSGMTEEDRARVNGIRRVGDLVRLASHEAASSLNSDKLLADIEAGIAQQEEAGFGEAFRVIEGGGGSQPAAESPSAGSLRPSEHVRPEGWKIVVPVAAGLLAAAVVLLVVLSGQRGVEHHEGGHAKQAVETVIETPAGNEVINVDLGQNAGTVFAVQGDAGEPLAVIWIEDEEVTAADTVQENTVQEDTAQKEGSSI